mgnify:CR=1 FL=1
MVVKQLQQQLEQVELVVALRVLLVTQLLQVVTVVLVQHHLKLAGVAVVLQAPQFQLQIATGIYSGSLLISKEEALTTSYKHLNLFYN